MTLVLGAVGAFGGLTYEKLLFDFASTPDTRSFSKFKNKELLVCYMEICPDHVISECVIIYPQIHPFKSSLTNIFMSIL